MDSTPLALLAILATIAWVAIFLPVCARWARAKRRLRRTR